MTEPNTPPASGQTSPPVKKQDWVLIVLLVAATFYFMYTYSGPFRWFAEFQLRHWGKYSEKLSYVLTVLVLMAPAFAAKAILKKVLIPSSPPAPPASAYVATSAGLSAPVAVPAPKLHLFNFGVFAGLLFAGLGGFMWHRGATAGPLTPIDVAALERGERPASRYLEIDGIALWDDAPGVTGRKSEFYVPVVSPDWRPPAPVVVYLEVSESEHAKHGGLVKGPFRGLVHIEGLPGMLRDRLNETDIRPSENYIVLDYLNQPDTFIKSGRWLTLGGLAALLLGLVFAFAQKARADRAFMALHRAGRSL